jgi:hypothetical protein
MAMLDTFTPEPSRMALRAGSRFTRRDALCPGAPGLPPGLLARRKPSIAQDTQKNMTNITFPHHIIVMQISMSLLDMQICIPPSVATRM